MKYLTIKPDYTGSCIKDDFNGFLEPEELDISVEIQDELKNWHNAYRKIIPLDENERESMLGEIEALDKQGLLLMGKISKLLPDNYKLRYYSEGSFTYLT